MRDGMGWGALTSPLSENPPRILPSCSSESEIPSPGAAVNPSRGSRSCNIEGEEGKVSSGAPPPQLSTPERVLPFPSRLSIRYSPVLPSPPGDAMSRQRASLSQGLLSAPSGEASRDLPYLYPRTALQKSGSGATRSFPQSPANPCVPGTKGKHPLQHGKLTVNCLGIIPRSQRSRWAGGVGHNRVWHRGAGLGTWESVGRHYHPASA